MNNRTLKIFGKGGIRTHGDRKATPIFKIGAFNHSATFPYTNFSKKNKKIQYKNNIYRVKNSIENIIVFLFSILFLG